MFMDLVDGSFLLDDVTTLWEAGSYDDIPLLVGGEPDPQDSGTVSVSYRFPLFLKFLLISKQPSIC